MQGSPLPQDIIDVWPEVFGEVTYQMLPLQYLLGICIHFTNGTVWEIPISPSILPNHLDIIEDEIASFSISNDTRLDNIQFKLNIVQLKQDIQSLTNTFLHKCNQ